MRQAPWILGVALLAACRPATSAEQAVFSAPKVQPVKAELIAEHASIQPGGGKTHVGVHFNLEEGWHIYADPPGDAGIATTIEWSGECADFSALGTRWPRPQEFVDPGNIRTFGYDGSVVATIEMANRCEYFQVTKDSKMSVGAKVRWLACHDICIPGSAELTLALPLTLESPRPSTHAELFAQVDP